MWDFLLVFKPQHFHIPNYQLSNLGSALSLQQTGDEIGVHVIDSPDIPQSFLRSAFMENVTPPEQYELLELNKISGFVDRQRGTGRPTKKERRDLEQFTDEFDFDEFDWGE